MIAAAIFASLVQSTDLEHTSGGVSNIAQIPDRQKRIGKIIETPSQSFGLQFKLSR